MIIKASVKARKFSKIIFCLFIILSTVLVTDSVSLIFSMGSNIQNNINNHFLNRELTMEFPYGTSQEDIDEIIGKIENIDHVSKVYRQPEVVSATEKSGELNGVYSLAYLHYDLNPKITDGRLFEESETNVALVPEEIKDSDVVTKKITKIDGKDLIGKTLEFECAGGGEYKAKVIGVYNTSDPFFTGYQIIVPQNDLLKINEAKNQMWIDMKMTSNVKINYLISIDIYKYVDSVTEEISSFKRVELAQNLNIDADSYNIALILLFVILLVFIVMVISGLVMFLNSSVNNRTNELALYRSLGYKSKHLFEILFTEYLIFGVISLALGAGLTALLNTYVVNPYLFTLVGNTIMEMTVSISAVQIICVLLAFVAILFLICRHAVKRSEKIDLTVLLRER